MDAATSQPFRFDFTSTDGLSIACARWDSRCPTRGVVQIAHGLGEHLGRYAGVIDVLVEAGIVVYGNDHRGHGRTALPTNSFGEFGQGGFNLLVEDLGRLAAIARVEHPKMPFFLLGHCLGSFAAQQHVLDHSRSISGLALSGTGSLDGLVRLTQSSNLPPVEILNAAFEPARTPCDWISRDPAAVDEILNDPLCFGWLQPTAIESVFAAAVPLADPVRLREIRGDLPVYAFSGSADPVGQRLAGVRVLLSRYREGGLRDVSHDFYPGGRHEMLNDINRDEVRPHLLWWITRVLAGASQTQVRTGAEGRRRAQQK